MRESLTTGLEATLTNYNRGGISLSSGYRTPSGNANVRGVFGSYHVRGRAADMRSTDNPWTEAEFDLLKEASLFASGRLTEVESRAHYVSDIHDNAQNMPAPHRRGPGSQT